MNRELYIHTLRMLREQYEIARMDTVVETIDAALAEFERPTDSDCISRQAAVEAIRNMQTYKMFEDDDTLLVDKAEVQTELMMLPSVQSEAIRCKDCLMHGVCRFEQGLGLNGYCSKAERREG